MEQNTTLPEESGQPEIKRRQISPEEKARRAERAKLAREAKVKVAEDVPVTPEPPKVFVSHGVKIPQIIPVRRRTSIVNIRA